MRNVSVSNLQSFFDNRDVLFLVGLGFDERGLHALRNVSNEVSSRAVALLNPKRQDINQLMYVESFLQASSLGAKVIGIDSASVLEVIDSLQGYLCDERVSYSEILVDITSLSHELLVALIGLFVIEGVISKVSLIYTGAAKYSFNTDSDMAWLSRGVSDIRSILGFPGLILPSKSLHLVIMAGFESERAAEVISRYEPAKLTIAHGARDESVCLAHYERNKSYAASIETLLNSRGLLINDIASFEFSCVDPYRASEQIYQYVSGLNGDNVILCPLNTKMSTVGAALAGVRLPKMQICYAQAAEYNLQGYAMAGDEITVVSLSQLDLAIGDI
ncbi:hypothetical protein HU763_014860 [Pseudomonas anuradhapurensis]|uniref:hypothetical protein n=1 Tax=Pseudomonas anuradhapurensis TaxID=485870 RepID=UPI0016477DD7|nr:hypothetical protein [Pseudomonas anuradhapurensis]QXI46056.1 hypothetical protein HU763_014860 [Pseudomonas anuradhapurensis]